MSEENFTIKEVLEKYMDTMKDTINDISRDVKDIKLQGTIDSGRISKLEWWKAAVIWAIGVIIAFLLFVMPYMLKFIDKVNQIDYTITTLTDNYNK